MHLYIATRGASSAIEKFKGGVESQCYALPNAGNLTGIDGKKLPINMFTVMRPVQLWELVFPKEALNSVLKTVETRAPIKPKKQRKWMQKEWLRQNKYIYALQKLLKLKAIPKEFKPTGDGLLDNGHLINKRDVDVIILGTREDAMGNPMEML